MSLEHITAIENIPILLNNDLTQKDVFNMLQDSIPVNELIGLNFKITGLLPQIVNFEEKEEIDLESGEMVQTGGKKLKLVIFTDHGVFHSYSVSLNGSIRDILNIYKDEYKELVFSLTQKTKNKKVVYVLKIV